MKMARKIMDLVKDFWLLGFIAAIGTGFLLKFISQIVSMIPGVTLNLQAISVETTEVGGVVGTGLSTFAEKLFSGISLVTIPDFIFLGIGGALFVILGAFVVDRIKLLQFAKTTQGKLATIFVTAGIVSGWILAASVGIPAISGIIVMSVNALILSFILVRTDEVLRFGLTKNV